MVTGALPPFMSGSATVKTQTSLRYYHIYGSISPKTDSLSLFQSDLKIAETVSQALK